VRLLRAVVALGVLAGVSVTVLAGASDPVTCSGASVRGTWQELPLGSWPAPEGVPAKRVATAYAVDPVDPRRVVVTDGTSVKLSDRSGCGFRTVLTLGQLPTTEVPVSGAQATVVEVVVLPSHTTLLVLDEQGRTRVLASDDAERGTWRVAETGLPPGGAPQAVTAGTGGTAYLALAPSPATGVLGVPASPGGLFATEDGGATWQQRGGAATVTAGLTALAGDPGTPGLLHAIAGDDVVRSTDGGRTFAVPEPLTADGTGYVMRALSAPAPGVVLAAAVESEHGPRLVRTTDGGRTWSSVPAPSGVVAVAGRGSREALLETDDHRVRRLDALDGRTAEVTPSARASAYALSGARASSGAYHALTPTRLLRYVDPVPQGQTGTGRVPVHGVVPPPVTGTLSPAAVTVEVPAGATVDVPLTLSLPRSRSPLDVYFLIDSSKSMEPVIADLQAGIEEVLAALAREGVDVEVGVATIGTAAADGSADPPTSPTDRSYRQPQLYQRLRAVGDVAGLSRDLAGLQTETSPNNGQDREEGQLVALDQMVTGEGVEQDGTTGAVLYRVAPGQQAGWRQDDQVRRVAVLATDGGFGNPPGTPRDAAGRPDFGVVVRQLVEQRVALLGLSEDFEEADRDLGVVARGTGALASGSVACGDGIVVAPGAPLVCGNNSDFSKAVLAMLRDYTLAPEPVTYRGLAATGPTVVDLAVARTLPVVAHASCAGLAAGDHPAVVQVGLRGAVVATSRVVVRCLPGSAVLRPGSAEVPGGPALNPQPNPPAPGAPQPPAPVSQVQVQGQPGVQAQPGAAAEQEKEVQLALAAAEQARAAQELESVQQPMAARGAGAGDAAAQVGLFCAMGLAAVTTVVVVRRREEPSLDLRSG
jgi:hypothetical protein